MSNFLCISVRFLEPAFHGRGDLGEPEWPPSPLRVFQALVAAAAGSWNERTTLTSANHALCWLEEQPPPLLIAPQVIRSSNNKYRLYVPDNVADLVARSWVRGNDASIADYRTEKDVHCVRLPADNPAVHYLYPITMAGSGAEASLETLTRAAHSLTHLGWGVDMVVGHAEIITEDQAAALSGERWLPTTDFTATTYRVPQAGTLQALAEKHTAFLERIDGTDSFKPVPPLSTFGVTGYRTTMEYQPRPFAAFSLLKPDASGFRAFDTPRRLKAVAGMLRNAAKRAAFEAGWEPDQINGYILGHAERPGEPHRAVDGPRLGFLPVPSIQPKVARAVTEIRRVIVVQFNGENPQFKRLANLLSGTELIPKPSPDAAGSALFADELEWETPALPDANEPLAMLARLPNTEKTIERYVGSASTWATVTPVILPGYDDPRHFRRRLGQGGIDSDEQRRLLEKLDERVEALLRLAITQAGYPQELAQHAQLEWSGAGYWPGIDLASRYALPAKLNKFPRLHVRITWRNREGNRLEIPGPICLGGGRFAGFGLFAAQ